MAMNQDFITGAEFARWMQEESNFRTRLEHRIGEQHSLVRGELSEIKSMVKEANGRTGKNSEAIAVIARELEAIKSEENEIEQTLQAIRDEGCSQYAAHVQVLRESTTVAEWSLRKKAAAAGGFVGIGALIWPAIQEVARAVHAVIEWMGTR